MLVWEMRPGAAARSYVILGKMAPRSGAKFLHLAKVILGKMASWYPPPAPWNGAAGGGGGTVAVAARTSTTFQNPKLTLLGKNSTPAGGGGPENRCRKSFILGAIFVYPSGWWGARKIEAEDRSFWVSFLHTPAGGGGARK